MKTSILSIIVLALLQVLSCSTSQPTTTNQTDTITKSYPLADEKLWTLFEKFENEANSRGRTINLVTQQIKATIENIPTAHKGLCNRANNNQAIVIDQNFWNSNNEYLRELIVFHELGHCSLNLQHRENQTNGICESIMRSGNGCIDNYTASTRNKYLNELFSTLD